MKGTLSVSIPRRRAVDTVAANQRAESFTKRSIKKGTKVAGLRLALSMVDLTTLEGKDSPEKVRSLCRKAMRPGEFSIEPPLPSVAAVCVYPTLVRTAKETLAGSAVKVASVATGFPSGQFPLDVRLADVPVPDAIASTFESELPARLARPERLLVQAAFGDVAGARDSVAGAA